MSKLKYGILSVTLGNATSLVAKTHNDTRYSSTYDMLLRYTKIRQFITKQYFEEVEEHLLTKKKNGRIDKVLISFSYIKSVTKALQGGNTTFSDARSLFDSVIIDQPGMAKRFLYDAAIVHSVLFKRSI